MAAVPLFRDTDMAAVTSRENANMVLSVTEHVSYSYRRFSNTITSEARYTIENACPRMFYTMLFACLSKILHEHCFYFLSGLIIVSRETGNNAYDFGGTNKQFYGIFYIV